MRKPIDSFTHTVFCLQSQSALVSLAVKFAGKMTGTLYFPHYLTSRDL
jgi:hypothetical protein